MASADSDQHERAPDDVIDVTGAARPFGLIKLALINVLLFSVVWLATTIPYVAMGGLTQGPAGDHLPAMLQLGLYTFAFTAAGIIAFANLSVVRVVRQHFTVTTLILWLTAMLHATLGVLYFWEGTLDDVTQLGIQGFSWIVTFLAVIAIALARGARIKGLHISTKTLMRRLAAHAARVGGKIKAPPKRPWLAALMIAVSLAIFVAVLQTPDDLIWVPINFVIVTLGYAGFVFARQALQPDADALLGADERAPIVFLRSFQDDKRISLAMLGEQTLLDYSLETRLASHFSRIGPFVAIGSPQDTTPELGAARALLSDDDWQACVTGWMDRAQLVVLMTGVTHWVQWELKTALTRVDSNKLLITFPQSRKLFGFGKESQERLSTLRQALAGTPWDAASRALDQPKRLRALLLEPNGAIRRIESRSRGRTGYHLAALAAHYLLLKRTGAV